MGIHRTYGFSAMGIQSEDGIQRGRRRMSETGGVTEPQRTCLGCRKTLLAGVLCRLQLVVDETGNATAIAVSSTSVSGRGAWICKAGPSDGPQMSASAAVSEDRESVGAQVFGVCAVTAKQKKAFSRGFRRDVPSAVVDEFLKKYS
jgi:predicted RNA-binding protein YlxR (DUF448 family)